MNWFCLRWILNRSVPNLLNRDHKMSSWEMTIISRIEGKAFSNGREYTNIIPKVYDHYDSNIRPFNWRSFTVYWRKYTVYFQWKFVCFQQLIVYFELILSASFVSFIITVVIVYFTALSIWIEDVHLDLTENFVAWIRKIRYHHSRNSM